MNERIRNTLIKIVPDEQQKARMRAAIETKAAKMDENMDHQHRTGRYLRIAAVAAALCCVFCMTAFAEEIGGFFSGLFVKDDIVAESVQTGVFYDSDEHITMTVEELLSDGAVVRMVVRYQAADEQGENWLNSLSYMTDDSSIPWQYGFVAKPDFKDNNTVMYGVNYYHKASELEEFRTKTERCFVIIMEADRFGWGTDNIIFDYTMTSGEKSVFLNIGSNIQKREMIIEENTDTDKLYIPLKAIVTPLSFIIEGRECGYVESGYINGVHYQRVVAEEQVDSLKLVFNDGTKNDLLGDSDLHNGAWTLCAGNQSSEENNIIIAGVSFCEPVDIDTVAGFELDGVYYCFD